MTTTRTDVTGVVLEQHKDVAERLSAVLNKIGNDRAEEFESLAEFLAAHEAAEESVIYPALRMLGDEGIRIADDRTNEEGVASAVLARLKGFNTDSNEFETMFAEFTEKVHEHAAREEAEVIPLLTSVTTTEQREEMGDAFLALQHGVPSRR